MNSERKPLFHKLSGSNSTSAFCFVLVDCRRTRMLTWEAKVVCFLKIWWRLNEALLNYLEAITIGMKSTLMKQRRFDDIHGDQGWNVCSPCSYIIKKVYLFVIHVVDLKALIKCSLVFVVFLICWMVF